ncbi:unnamed protein product [Vitrella brassicaformis CCMP3155]|uniref:t-SNARE coiled-coil homology domain-containing protein n=1 Tax=Vitrella brassicaformis (strain CCMP3155) TaxID=1169540 RepID=A0A0G4FCJ4_VITBC|nr:unnamed protein product [Vitrella brassicaformis CCMP3155]|eukprot:CEM10948.1 unnamed protein product [Vitrella brassicaformis CCMP3155]
MVAALFVWCLAIGGVGGYGSSTGTGHVVLFAHPLTTAHHSGSAGVGAYRLRGSSDGSHRPLLLAPSSSHTAPTLESALFAEGGGGESTGSGNDAPTQEQELRELIQTQGELIKANMELIQAQGQLIQAQQDALASIVEESRKGWEAHDKRWQDIVK